MRDVSLGQAGEIIAEKLLLAQKFLVVAKNYRCPLGEIDIIVQKDQMLYFIEVKTRSTLAFGRPAEAVTPAKQIKLRQLALYYVSASHYDGPVAFGVVEVLYNRSQNRYTANWVPHAF